MSSVKPAIELVNLANGTSRAQHETKKQTTGRPSKKEHNFWITLSKLNPGTHGFTHWSASPNYFDLDPTFIHHDGTATTYEGDSSDVVIDVALQFMQEAIQAEEPFFAYVCYGPPHDRPFKALPADQAVHGNAILGEMVGVDRSVGTLEKKTREWGIAENTIIWYASDNGANDNMLEGTPYEGYNGHFRGAKGTIWKLVYAHPASSNGQERLRLGTKPSPCPAAPWICFVVLELLQVLSASAFLADQALWVIF